MAAAKRPSSAALAADREIQRAEIEATLDDLERILRILRRAGGYLAPEDQIALRAAQARLATHGRSVDDAPTRSAR